MPKITKRTVDGLKPGEGDTFAWDDEIKGFGVRCRPSGVKTYVLKARVGGRQRWLTIGRHGSPWTPDEARKEALKLLSEIVAGGDPAAKREKEKKAATIGELADLFLAEGCSTQKPSTVTLHRGHVQNHIKPLLGARRLDQVTRADVERFQAAVRDGKTASDRKGARPRSRVRVRGGIGCARHSMITLAAIFAFGVRRGLMEKNHAVGVKRFAPGKSERFLSAAEMARLGEAIAAAEAASVNPVALGVIRCLALTGARLGEVRKLRWSEVDFERSCLRLPDSKTGFKTIPLGAAALAVIAAQERLGEHVFPSSVRTSGPVVDIKKAWSTVRTAAGLDGVRLHDLRHSFASGIVNAGGSLSVIGAILGHRSVATTARYAHLSDNPVRDAADRASASIAAALAGQAGAEVFPIDRKAR
jgi:integrase